MSDLISRQAAIDAVKEAIISDEWEYAEKALERLPSVQPEPLTDKEKRIFLAAMGREEKVCKQVDDEFRNCREPYEDSLVRTCHEITRKVKGALWELPSAQPERKKGKWIYGEDEYGIDGYHCDKCGFFVPWDYTHKFINYIEDYNFCPSCGADMRGEQDE